MGAVVPTRPGWLLLLAISFAACSPPPDGPVADAVAREAVAGPASDREAGPEPASSFRWPSAGWLWFEIDVFVALDGTAELDSRAVLAAVWRPGSVELWFEAGDSLDPDAPVSIERVTSGADAAGVLSGLRGRFDAGVLAGFDHRGLGARGGEVFVATERQADVTVTERWEIGEGASPWGASEPFVDGS